MTLQAGTSNLRQVLNNLVSSAPTDGTALYQEIVLGDGTYTCQPEGSDTLCDARKLDGTTRPYQPDMGPTMDSARGFWAFRVCEDFHFLTPTTWRNLHVTLRAANTGKAVLDGEGQYGVLHVGVGCSVTLIGVQVTRGGYAAHLPGITASHAMSHRAYGGGITVQGRATDENDWSGMQVIEPAALHLIDSSVTDSVILHVSGGGIACDGRCTMTRGQVANNRAISGAGVRVGGAFKATGVAIVNNLIDPSLRVGCSMPVSLLECGYGDMVMVGAGVYIGTPNMPERNPYESPMDATFSMDGGSITGNGVKTDSPHLMGTDTSRGGAFYLRAGAIVAIKGAANLTNNHVDEGKTFYNEDTFAASFGFPTTPGHWMPSSDCIVERAQCCADECGAVASIAWLCPLECRSRELYCAITPEGSETAVVPINESATTYIAIGTSVSALHVYGSGLSRTCCTRNAGQTCKWQADTSLLGSTHAGLASRTLEVPMPYICTPGLVGSNATASQVSAVCAGRCPAGFYCPDEATLTAVPCPGGAVCAEGASAPLPCPAGFYGDPTVLSTVGYLTSLDQCLTCPAGSYCPVGTAAPMPCLAGSFTASPGASTCDRCDAGSYISTPGATACVTCISNHFCPMGSSVPQPCPSGFTSNPDLAVMSSSSQCIICPAGYWCAPGIKVACDADFYNNVSGASNQQACKPCPDNSATRTTGTDNMEDCECKKEYYDTILGPGVDCELCMYGTDCSKQGAAIDKLPLVRGFYRIADTSSDVRKCPDYEANCSDTAGTALCVSTSGCVGGANASALCAPGLTGTFCRECVKSPDPAAPLRHYVKASNRGEAHCAECGSQLAVTAAMGAGLLVALVLAVLALAKAKTKPIFNNFMVTFTPQNKAKILIGFYMIATKVDNIYEVSMPNDVVRILNAFSSVFSFGMQGVATTPLACVGFDGYVYELLFWLVFPAAACLLVLIYAVALACLCRRKNKKGATIVEQVLPPVLRLMFVLYPLVTTAAFEGFPCYEFESGDGWLIADVSIKCRTPDHASATTLAWIAVFVYPIGFWLVSLLLLMRASKAITSGVETPLSRSLIFLYKEYDLACFWWELMEMARKFLLVGLFVTLAPGSITQIAGGTIVSAVYLMIQLQAKPYKHATDDYLATSSSFGLLMIFICSIVFKYTTLTESADIQEKMSIEQEQDYVVSTVVISIILLASVLGSLVMVGFIAVAQLYVEAKRRRLLRRLKYAKNGKWVELAVLADAQAFHLFLSHAWPAAQDRMRIIKARFAEALPSCKIFLDVDNLKSGSGTAEVDKSECILVFCTKAYFEKKNSLKELYRAVVQRRPILTVLEPDATQDGGLDQAAVTALLTDARLDKFKLRKKWAEWKEEGELLPAAFDHAPDGAECAAALFATPPVEWNRLPHFQDVTIRLIAQNGVLHGTAGELYLQGEAAMDKVMLPKPFKGREYHLFCSPFNAGAKEVAEELKEAPVFTKASAPLTYTTDATKLFGCDHMLVLLDERTWTSGEDTAKFVEHIHEAMKLGVHLTCVHEFPAVVGPPRHECEFALMFGDDWTPSHLTSGETNLYKEIALALKGVEWRLPGMVAFASKLAASAGPRVPLDVKVPDTYEAKKGSASSEGVIVKVELEPLPTPSGTGEEGSLPAMLPLTTNLTA